MSDFNPRKDGLLPPCFDGLPVELVAPGLLAKP